MLLTFSGTASSKSSTVTSVSYAVTVTDESASGDSSRTIQTITGSASIGNSSDSTVTWLFGTEYGTGYTAIESGKEWLYTITLTVKDENGNTTESTKRIHVDTVKPVVTISSITPLVNASSESKAYVNGTITISTSIDESNLSSSSYKVYVGGITNDYAVSVASSQVLAGYSPKFTLNTAALDDNKLVRVVITSVDKAGNVGTYTTYQYNVAQNLYSDDIYINQDTDKPLIKFSNADSSINDDVTEGDDTKYSIKEAYTKYKTDNTVLYNIFGQKSNNNIIGSITDDDGIKKVTVGYRAFGSSASYTTADIVTSGTATTYTINYALCTIENGSVTSTPLPYGAYDFEIIVTDTAGATNSTNSSSFVIAIDNGAPTFSSVTPSDDGNYSGVMPVNGKITDESGTVTLALTSTNEKNSTYATSKTLTNAAAGVSFSDTTLTVPQSTDHSKDGNYTLIYTAADTYGQSSTYSIKYNVDTRDPFIGNITMDPVATNSYISSATPLVTVQVSDTWSGSETVAGSGIASVTYTVSGTTRSLSYKGIDTTDSNYYAYEDKLNLSEGKNDIVLVVTDKAGNSKTSKTYTYYVDTVAPTIGAPVLYDTATYVAGTSTAIDSQINKSDYASYTKGIAIVATVTDTGTGAVAAWLNDSSVNEDSYSSAAITSTQAASTAAWSPVLVIPKTDLTEGTHAYYVHAKDAAGKTSVSSVITFTVDTLTPTLGISNLSSNKVYTENDVTSIAESSSPRTAVYTVSGTWFDATSGTSVLQYTTSSSPDSLQDESTSSSDAASKWVTVSGTTSVSNVSIGWTAALAVTESMGNTISFRAKDAYGNISSPSKFTSVTFDFSKPSWGTAAVITTPTNKTVQFIETASDVLAMYTKDDASDINISVTAKKNGSVVTDGYTVEYTGATKTSVPVTITVTAAENNSADGSWEFSLVPTDAAGRADGTIIRSFVLDTKKPVIDDDKAAIGSTYTATTIASKWFNSTTQKISGRYSDGTNASGISKVFYRIGTEGDYASIDATPDSESGYYDFSAAVSSFSKGKNTLYVYAKDDAGNESATSEYTIKVDSDPPAVTAADKFISNNTLSNATSAIEFTGTATDADSGVESLSVTVGTVTVTSGVSSSYGTLSLDSTSGATTRNWTLTMNPGWLALLNNTVGVTATVTDVAGTSTTSTVCYLEMDKTAPTVTFKTSAVSSTVNKTFTVTGTASDTRKLATGSGKGSLFIKSSSGSYPDTGVSVDISSDGTWTTDVDTTAYTTSVKDTLTMYLIVKDEAGNSSSATTTQQFNVDQNTDRPTVKITSLSSDGATLMYGENASISGTVTDDDSTASKIIKTFIAASSKITSASATNVTATENIPVVTYNTSTKVYETKTIAVTPSDTAVIYKLAVTNSYTDTTTHSLTGYDITIFDPTTGDFTFIPYDVCDGTKTTNFYCVDNASTVFYTANGVSLNQTYVQFKSNAKKENTSAISYLSDSLAPTIKSVKISYGDDTSAGDFAGKSIETSLILGGTSYRYAKFAVEAADASGIASITVAASDSSDTAKTFTQSTTSSSSFTTSVLDMSTWKTGSVSVTVTVYDNSGLYSNNTTTFMLDNSGPSVTMTSPLTTDEVTGNVAAAGTTTEVGSAGVSYTGWLIPTTDQQSLGDADLYALTAWQSKMPDGKTASIWEFDFNGTNATTNPSLSNFSNKTYCSTIASGVYTIPVYFKATDANGNYTISRTYVKYNRDADKPTATVTYPSTSDYDSGVKYVTLGGTVRASGTATDNVSVSAVYYQIDWDGDGDFDTTDRDLVAASLYSSAQIYPVYAATSALKDANATAFTYSADIASGWTDGTTAEQETEAAAWWGIKADNTASWSATLNVHKELNATDTYYADSEKKLRLIHIRACALDNYKKVGGWSDSIGVMIDKDAPEIGQAVLYQYDSTVTTAAEAASATPIASKTYTTDMYLTGQWYLSVSAVDESGIESTYTVNKDSVEMTSSEVAATAITTSPAGYKFFIKLSTKDGSSAYQLEVTDKSSSHSASTAKYTLKNDNTAPKISTLLGNGNTITSSTPVANTNYRYTLSGDVTDANSGFSRMAFYFLRSSSTANSDRVYDPEIEYDETYDSTLNYNATNALSHSRTNTVSIASQTAADSIPFYGYNGSTGSATSGVYKPTASDTILNNKHIRKGGLIYIGGEYRRISAIDASSGAVSFTPVLGADISSVTPFFPYAQVVDNTATETTDWNAGKYTLSGDDGDDMPESIIKDSSTWSWSGTIYSDYMPDGPITIVCVAFDNAGNISATSITTSIQNNAPRLAKMYLGTDLNGSGTYSSDELVQYNILGIEGSYKSSVSIKTGSEKYSSSLTPFTIKNGMAVVPEFTGGNGDVEMIFQRDASTYSETQKLGGTNIVGLIPSKASVLSSDAVTLVSGSLAATSNSYDAYVLTNEQISGKTGDISSSNNNDGTGLTMSFTFWDSTEETTVGSTSNSCLFTVTDFIEDLYDDTKPFGYIKPFYWNSSSDNSLYGNSKSNGHIELESDLPSLFKSANTTGLYDREPKVSGKIRVVGYAYDNTRLASISASIDGINLGAGTGSAQVLSTYSSGAWSANSSTIDGTYGYTFTVSDVSIGQTGHAAKWELDVDTSKLSTVAGLDKLIFVTTKDAAGNTADATAASYAVALQTATKTVYATANEAKLYHFYSTASAANTADASYATDTNYAAGLPSSTLFTKGSADSTYTTVYAYTYAATPYYRVDVVPYISKIGTSLTKQKVSNPSVYNRTALGHYPVQSVVSNITGVTLKTSTSETVTLYGFNLNGSSPSVTGITTVNSATAGQLSFNAGELASGKPTIKVSGIEVLNNSNNNDSCGSASSSGTAYANWYNREANGDTNNNLTDDIYFDVWEFNDRAAVPLNGLVGGVQMKINPKTKMLNYAFANGSLFYSMAGNVISTDYSSYYWAGDWDVFTGACVGFTVDDLGYTYSSCSGGDTNSSGAADTYAMWSSRWGVGAHTSDGTYGINGAVNEVRLEKIALKTGTGTYNYDLNKNRCLSPEYASSVSGTSTNLYHIYYDALCDEIRFRAGTITTDTTSATSTMGFTDQYTGEAPSGYDITNCQVIANGDTGKYQKQITGRGAGNYVAIAVAKDSATSKDVVCAVWYDSYANNLKYSYIVDPITNWASLKADATANKWSSATTIFAEGGEYCHIAVDKNNHIHIAAYAGNGDVKYAYLDTYGADSSYTEAKNSCIVDASGTVGEHLTLDVALDSNGYSIPYIGYYTSAVKMPKYAYLVDTTNANHVPAGVDADERFTGAWEAAVVPTPSRITSNREDKINVGVWKDLTTGKLTDSKVGGVVLKSTYKNTLNSYNSTSWSKTYGNGTSNGVLSYQIANGSGSCIETAQKR